MNRVIKFEYGFSNHSPIKMTLVEQIQDFNQHYNPMSMGCIKYIRQYTGLLDKDGKEIYEGDLLQMDDLIVPVIFEDGSFQIKTNTYQGSSHLMQDRAKRFQVVGNIYRNPELLEEN